MSSIDGDPSFLVDFSTSSRSSSSDSNAEMGILKTKVNNQAASVFGKPYEAKRAVKFIASPITGGLSYIKRGVGYLGAVAADKYARSTIISGPAGIDAAKIELTREHLQKIEEAETKLETLNSQASGDIAKFLNLAVCAEDYSHTEKALQMLVKQIASSNDSNEVGKLKEAFNASFQKAIVGSNSWTNQKIISLFLKFPMLVSDWNQLCKQGSTVNAKFGREKLIKDSFVKTLTDEISHTKQDEINPQLKEMMKFPELVPQDHWSSSTPEGQLILEHVGQIIDESNLNNDTQLISRFIKHIPSSVIPWGTVYDEHIDPQNQPGIKKALEKKITEDFLSGVTGEDTEITINKAIQKHPEMVDWVQVINNVETRKGLGAEKKEDIIKGVLTVLDEQINTANNEPKAILLAAKLEIDILSTEDKSTIDIKKYIGSESSSVILWEKLFEVADRHEEVKQKLSDEFHAVIREYAKTDSKIISKGWSLAKRIDWKQILSESKEAEPSTASAAGVSLKIDPSKPGVAMAAPTGKPADSLEEDQKKALVTQTIIDSLELKDEKFVDEDTAKKLLQFPEYLDVDVIVDVIAEELKSHEAMIFFVNEEIQSILASDLNDAEKEEKIAEFLNDEQLVSYVDWAKIADLPKNADLEGLLKSNFEKIINELTNNRKTYNITAQWESCIKCRWFKDIKIHYNSVFNGKGRQTAEVLKRPFYEALLEDPTIISESNGSYVDWTKAFKEIKGDHKKENLNEKFNEYLVFSLNSCKTNDSVDRLVALISENKEQIEWESFNQSFRSLKTSTKESIRFLLKKLLSSDLESLIESDINIPGFQKWITDRSEFIDWTFAKNEASKCIKEKREGFIGVLNQSYTSWRSLQGK